MILHRFQCVVVLLALASCPGLAFGQVVHVLLVGDTNDRKIGPSVETDLENLTELLESLIPRQQLDLVTVKGNGVSWDGIISQLVQFSAADADAMIFFYSGHGAFDAYDDGMSGHFFQMPNGERLYRSAVVRHVARRGAGLDAVISCSCSVFVPLPPAPGAAPPMRRDQMAPLAESLFFTERGLLNINSASEGEYAFGNPVMGSTLYHPFCNLLRQNSEQALTWKQVLDELRPGVQDTFRQMFPFGFVDQEGRRQRTQTLRVWHTPPGAPADVRGKVYATSLDAGDVIRSINGRVIRTEADFTRAVKQSPEQMIFTIVNVRDGLRMHLGTTLNPPQARSRLGVYVEETGGQGVRVTGVLPDSPGTRLEIMGRQRGPIRGD